MKNIRKTMKKGITLIEIILAIVLIALILGIAIPKLMSNSTQAEIKQVVVSDVKSIFEAAALWRRSSAAAQGTYVNITPLQILSRMPNTMTIDANGLILSSGLRTGEDVNGNIASDDTGIKYTIAHHVTNPAIAGTSPQSFSIFADITGGDTKLGWNANLQAYALDVFRDTVTQLSTGNTPHAADFDSLGASPFTFECSDNTVAICFTDISIR